MSKFSINNSQFKKNVVSQYLQLIKSSMISEITNYSKVVNLLKITANTKAIGYLINILA